MSFLRFGLTSALFFGYVSTLQLAVAQPPSTTAEVPPISPEKTVGVDDVAADAARDVIRASMQECETILGVRTIAVYAQEFASSSINFEVVWWTGSKPIDIRRSRDEVIAAIKHGLDSAGIEIPFPYRTLTFQDASVAAAIASAVSETDHRSPDA